MAKPLPLACIRLPGLPRKRINTRRNCRPYPAGFKTYGLPFECGLTLGTLTEAIALDKKNLNGNLNVILLHEIGDSYIEATDIQFFAETARLV